MRKIRIGTRKSLLALVQTDIVKHKIIEAFPDTAVEVVELSTRGDEILDRSLVSIGGKGVFTQELEEALLEGSIDLAVHSAKDMPMEFPKGLCIGAVLDRADVRDILVTMDGTALTELPDGSVIGTSSLRRELQLKELHPLLKVKVIRGNVQTRLRKLKEGQYDAIVLAAAGVERLNMKSGAEFHFEYLNPDEFLPAAGQGILAVESREGDLTEILSAIHSADGACMLEAERSFLSAIGGSCNAPAAGYSRIEGDQLIMKVCYSADGKTMKRAELTGKLTEASALGAALAAKMKVGKVFLVGAGPGDMGLVTEKCLECVRRADVLVYDSLATNSLLNEAKDDAELIYAGKRAASHHLKQGETNALLIEKAREGKLVVRLKGGDPFIFGRGGEEAQELTEGGVPFEIVPGVSSSYAAAAYAGIPVTHRDFASSFHVITGHEGDHKSGHSVLDYGTLAREEGTLVFLMGLKNLPNISANLIAGGKDPKTPVAVIQEGTTARQKTAVGTLENIAEVVRQEGIQTPAATIVGGVVSLRKTIQWLEKEPLFGKRVLVTATRDMTKKIAEELKSFGAEPIAYSLIRTAAVDSREVRGAFEQLGTFSWIVFTSANGVRSFFEQLKIQQLDVRTLSHVKIGVIGAGTRDALADFGIHADFMPSSYTSSTMAQEWVPTLTKEQDHVLLLRAREGSRELTDALLEADIDYSDVALYETVSDDRKAEELNRMLPGLDYITFASASAAKAFASMVPDAGSMTAKVICIGPVTEKAVRALGIPVYKSAVTYTAEGIRDVLLSED